jgi:hypothetical protein
MRERPGQFASWLRIACPFFLLKSPSQMCALAIIVFAAHPPQWEAVSHLHLLTQSIKLQRYRRFLCCIYSIAYAPSCDLCSSPSRSYHLPFSRRSTLTKKISGLQLPSRKSGN